MQKLIAQTTRFLVSEDGPTAVEYAVMLSLIIVVCIAAVQLIGVNTKNMFVNISNSTAS